jgi:serine/threonine protein kinase
MNPESTSELTAEQLALRAHECRLLELHELDTALSVAGGRTAPAESLARILLQQEKLTNWQIQRLMEGHRRGYFYGHWRVLYLVGAGTFARVYRGSHNETGDIKAIKVLRNRYSADHQTRDQFLREARMVMKLRHPNIVPIFEVDEFQGRIYMVMDFVEGQNLRDYVKAHGKLDMMVALRIARDLAAGLEYAFDLGICHRDMKLSNVLLSTKRLARMVDFGLAAANSEDDDSDDFNPRSIDYAGLEKSTNVRRDDKRSDIFFLGCVLYHMLTGKAPLLETRERIRRLSPRRYKEIEPVTNHEPQLPHRVVILINHLMELDPEKRTQTPGDAFREIEAVIDSIESGNLARYDEKLVQKHAEDYAKMVKTESEGHGHTIMVIESNPKVQDSLRARLKELGYRPLIISDPHRAIRRFEDLDPAEERPASCIIVSCAGLGRDGIDGFNYLASHRDTAGLPMILLVTKPLQKVLQDAKLSDHRVALDLPLKFKEVRQTLRQLLAINERAADEQPDQGAVGE